MDACWEMERLAVEWFESEHGEAWKAQVVAESFWLCYSYLGTLQDMWEARPGLPDSILGLIWIQDSDSLGDSSMLPG